MTLRPKDNIPIGALRAFVAISECGSFTKAAEQLNLTQPAVSLQIKQLEKILGGDLFVKRKVGVALSELGMSVDRLARRILNLNNQLIGIAGRAPQHETIHLGIQCIFAETVLPYVVEQCPATDTLLYKYVCAHTAGLSETLKSGFVDLAVMTVGDENRRNLVAEWTEKFVWVRSSQHPATPADDAIPFVARQQGTMDRIVLDILDEREIPYRIVFNATDVACMYAAIKAGIGLMCVPERTVPDFLTIARERHLPKLPDLRVGIFCTEGFDRVRHRPLIEAFMSAVQPQKPDSPGHGEPHRPGRSRQTEPEGLGSS
jgi:DNA-binding transcriptional LysR family regulator